MGSSPSLTEDNDGSDLLEGGLGKEQDDETENSTTKKTDKSKKEASSESSVDELTEQVASKLHIDESTIPEELKIVAKWIEESENILVLFGAGVSVSAGIMDFRTPGTGLYDNLQKYDLPYPEAVFDLGFYKRNPTPFCTLAKEIWPGIQFEPTLTHSFVKLLSQQDKLLRLYSQNIDGLEFLAGIPEDQLIECHGHFRTASCTKCGEAADGDEVKDVILNTSNVPRCKSCESFVKPDIVFFGEGLPGIFHDSLQRDLHKADLLLIIGTSLMVAPVSMIPEWVNCRRVLLNRERVGNLSRNLKRDVFQKGDCDDSVTMISKLMGCEETLLELNSSARSKLKEEKMSSSAGAESDPGEHEEEEEDQENEQK